MVAQVGALRVTVGADITGLQTGMKRAERQVAQSAGVMQRAVGGINKSFVGLGSIAGVALGGAGVLAAGSAFLRIADAAKSMNAQLKLATAEFGSFAKAQKDVRDIAERTRSDLLATSTLYAGIQRQAGRFGITQDEAARITETLTKSLKISGATAQESAQALRQFGQAFTQGFLNSDEFRTMRELAPRAMKAIAQATGETEDKLRELSEKGALHIGILKKALSDPDIVGPIDKEFAQLPVTFDEAMTGVYNAAIIVFSAFDQGGQFSNSIADFVTQGTAGFEELEAAAFRFGRDVSDAFAAVQELRNALASMSATGTDGFLDIANAGNYLRDSLAEILGLLDATINKFVNLYNLPGNIIRKIRGDGVIVDPVDMRGGFLASTNKSRIDAEWRRINAGTAELLAAGRTPPPYRAPPGKEKKPKKPKAPPRDRSEDVAFKFEQELRQAQMDILKAQQDLAGTAGDRSDLSLKMLDLEGQQLEAELQNNVRKAQRDLAEKKITETTFLEVQAHAEALRSKHAEVDQLKRQEIMQEATLHRMERADALAERGLQNRIDGLEFDDEMATTQAEHRRIQLEIVDTLYKQKEAHLRALKAQLEFAGKIEEAADVQAEIDRLPTEQGRERDRVIRGTRGPLEDWAASIPQTAAQINEAMQSIQVQGLEGLSDAIGDVITGTKSLTEAFGDMARQIITDILRMTIRMLVFKAISSAFPGLFGGSSSAGGNILDSGIYSDVPKFATGGSFTVGGRGGVDNNVLQINGLPVARVSQGEQVSVSPMGGGGAGRLMIVPSPYFDVVVDGRASRVAAPMAGQSAIMGAGAAMAGMERRRSRTLP